MNAPDLSTPQARAAAEFMAYKGYPDIHPNQVDKVEGRPIWYFYYDLPHGILELEVEQDRRTGEWSWSATAFTPHEERTPTPA